ncbi:MAG: hypothetical protein AAFR21_12060 [Pseudomonadota bacterium]
MPAKRKSATKHSPAPYDRFEWDSEVPGLALRHRSGRAPAWYVQKWTDGRSVRRSIGPAKSLSLEQAREMARALIPELTGETPPSPLVPETPKATVTEFAERFLEHGKLSWKPATLRAHRSLLASSILPQFGLRDVASIAPQEVAAWFAHLT